MRAGQFATSIATLISILALIACDKENEPAPPITCSDDAACPAGMRCWAITCRPAAEVAAIELENRQLEELRRRQEQAKEYKLLKASGLQPNLAAEQSPLDAGPPPDSPPCRGQGCVRVVETQGDSPIFAACRPEERLLSGGCKAAISVSVKASYPSHFSVDDSRGGRWNCEGASKWVKKPMQAFALCQQVDR